MQHISSLFGSGLSEGSPVLRFLVVDVSFLNSYHSSSALKHTLEFSLFHDGIIQTSPLSGFANSLEKKELLTQGKTFRLGE